MHLSARIYLRELRELARDQREWGVMEGHQMEVFLKIITWSNSIVLAQMKICILKEMCKSKMVQVREEGSILKRIPLKISIILKT